MTLEQCELNIAQSKFYGQAERAISTGKLHALLHFNLQPINQVVFLGPSFPLRVGRSHLRACFPLICIQRLSQPNFATQPCHWHDNWNTRGSSIPCLSSSGQPPSNLLRPQQIETELSRDVLNPAHVPL